MAFGAIVRQRREARGISLREFARRCEISPAHLSKIERALSSPSLDTLARIVQRLDLHQANLFGRGEGERPVTQVVRADDAVRLPAESGDLRVAAQTPGATVVLGHGGPDSFPPPTTSPAQVIVVVLEGAVEAAVGDGLFALGTGDALIVPASTSYATRITGGPATRTATVTTAS